MEGVNLDSGKVPAAAHSGALRPDTHGALEPTCQACGRSSMRIFHEVFDAPSNSCIQLDSPEEARAYPRGDIRLAFCDRCGFVSNVAFDKRLTEYSARYEETQGFSPTFNAFHRELAERLIERHDLHGKDVIEIGCGKGEFLALLCDLGGNRGVGFDPGYLEGREGEHRSGRIRFIKDLYSERYVEQRGDFICCKMTLEHIYAASDFVGTVRRSIQPGAQSVVFFQVPEVTRILRECAFEDIYYEHCSYFSPGSIARLFRRNGFEPVALTVEYGGQYLTIEARPAREGHASVSLAAEDDLRLLVELVESFPQRLAEKLDRWRSRLAEIRRRGQRVVLWGSGSKGVSFLTTLGVGDQVEYVVDINPHRQGHFMSGTGQPIVGPGFLASYRPDVVVVMNALYVDEIRGTLNGLGLDPLLLPL